MKPYQVTAVRLQSGWQLQVEGVGSTQVGSLDEADRQVRDLIETMDNDADTSNAIIILKADLGGLEEEVQKAKAATQRAGASQRAAASEVRRVAHALRMHGLSVSDTITLMAVPRP